MRAQVLPIPVSVRDQHPFFGVRALECPKLVCVAADNGCTWVADSSVSVGTCRLFSMPKSDTPSSTDRTSAGTHVLGVDGEPWAHRKGTLAHPDNRRNVPNKDTAAPQSTSLTSGSHQVRERRNLVIVWWRAVTRHDAMETRPGSPVVRRMRSLNGFDVLALAYATWAQPISCVAMAFYLDTLRPSCFLAPVYHMSLQRGATSILWSAETTRQEVLCQAEACALTYTPALTLSKLCRCNDV